MRTLKFIDLFCGIGGFRIAAENAFKKAPIKASCVFSSDIDPDSCAVYEANFNERPFGDITKTSEHNIPDHDLLFAGFPCQAFSICGDRLGFKDTRGTLFSDIARILKAKKPQAFVLENVKQLRGHDEGRTLAVIISALEENGYHVEWKILNALNFGLPQKRERIFIVGFRKQLHFEWPSGGIAMKPLAKILQKKAPESYYASEKIKLSRMEKGALKNKYNGPTIWHENKGGNISVYPFSCAMRAGASYNYLLVNGERRLTEREMLRLQGFPESLVLDCGYTTARRLTGNSLPIPVAEAVICAVVESLEADFEKVVGHKRAKATRLPDNVIYA